MVGCFRLRHFAIIISMVKSVIGGDASCEVTVFAIESGEARKDRLVAVLRGDGPPGLPEVPEDGDVFVDLTIGVDLGYYDSILVASRHDLGPKLDQLGHEYEQRVAQYESGVSNLADVDDLLAALGQLSGVD